MIFVEENSMQEKYKQRIIGAAVLLALIIVLVPIFVHHTHSPQKQRENRNMVSIREVIPPAPQKPQVKVKVNKTKKVAAIPSRPPRFPKGSAEYNHRATQLPPLPADSSIQTDAVSATPASFAAEEAKLRAQIKAQEALEKREHKLALERERLAKNVNAESLSPIKFYPAHKAIHKPVAQPIKGSSYWLIQLGSFHNYNNVKHLMKSLRAQGYPAFVVTKRTASTRWYRVMVGPISQHQHAQRTLNKLNQQTRLRGLLIEKRG